ncbi:hypothetical protein M378DRAFT_180581 [Amanita muscaria Koide BX008]|uniref:Uncharacterized protein n=1 Tax=Amanita muscaria (strain Koide BX008) TaxID=946122 RepID=A0A0C2WTH9_AMAMK|nr:hypothetical protein M378DRAFT_180581 [Amanita muscaria Koide BX008]
MSSDQELLTEQLQILNHLHYTSLGMLYQGSEIRTNRDNRDKRFNAEIRALDTVAVLLTTGEPNDVTAVTLDKRGKLELVIAKNRCPTYADDAAVRNLISLLTNPAIDDPEDIFPSIMTYCLKNINKRQLQLHESLSQFLPTVKQVLQQYSPSLLPTDDELPNLAAYLCFTHSDPTMDFNDIIVNIFQFCLTHSQHPLDSNDKDASYKAYSALCLGAHVLSHSQFLNKLTCDSQHPTWQQEAQKLKQRLLKVHQYCFGIRPLVLRVNRLFQNREIPYRWVDLSVIPYYGEKKPFEISPSFKEALLHVPVMDPAQTVQNIQKKHPSMFQQPWLSSIHTCIHAEIQIIIDLNPPTLSTQSSFNCNGPQEPRAIGCSERSCFCCTAWIESFNCQFSTQWRTSGYHNKPYTNWALPAVAYDMDGEGKSRIDRDVLRKVEIELVDVLEQFSDESGRELERSITKESLKKLKAILSGLQPYY